MHLYRILNLLFRNECYDFKRISRCLNGLFSPTYFSQSYDLDINCMSSQYVACIATCIANWINHFPVVVHVVIVVVAIKNNYRYVFI